jgi:hypothetical protein
MAMDFSEFSKVRDAIASPRLSRLKWMAFQEASGEEEVFSWRFFCTLTQPRLSNSPAIIQGVAR